MPKLTWPRFGGRSRSPWPPYLPAYVEFGNLTDERIAWLAAQPKCEALARRSLLTQRRNFEYHDWVRDCVIAYATAVDTVAKHLSPTERDELRRTGQLPDWFFPEVEAAYVPPVQGNTWWGPLH